MADKQDFVIISHGRTGSTLLTYTLRDMGMPVAGELFHEEAHSRKDARARDFAIYHPCEDGAEYLQRFYAAFDEPTGFKLFYDQARVGPAATAWDFLDQTPQIAVIHLIRRDLLGAMVSLERAFRSGVWTIKAGESGQKPTDGGESIILDPQILEAYFNDITNFRSEIRQRFSARRYVEIEYEDLRDNFEPTIDRIVAFLGAEEYLPTGPTIARQSRGDASKMVANFDELARHFKKSPHAGYFWSRRDFLPANEHPGFCSKPFDTLAIDSQGKLRMCCEDWLERPIGDARSGRLLDQWNSHDAQAIRASIVDGSYRYCNAEQCPDLVKGSLPPIAEIAASRRAIWLETAAAELAPPPEVLSLGYDPTCNLKCPTCRSDFIVLKGSAFDRAEQIHEEVVRDLLPRASRAVITGQGDAFASRLYRGFLQSMDAADYPNLKILLMTNGLAFTPQMWDSIKGAQPRVSGVSVSVDAASPETYAINRGGNFAKLMSNLEHMGSLYNSGSISFFELSFVVQANNYREMPAFVALAKRMGCDSVLFMKLIYWEGTFAKEEWPERSVHRSDHPEHEQFLKVLTDPLLADPIVDLSNLADLIPRQDQAVQ